MERMEIFETVRDFLNLLKPSNVVTEPNFNIRELARVLDRLTFAYHYVDFEFDENQKDPPKHDPQMYLQFREIISQKFPTLSYYSFVDPMEIEQAEMKVGDTIDDLANIAGDLQDVLWYLENTTEEDALWHFQFGYESHWGRHIRYLQTYLYEMSN